jgi:hypothetical protein
MTMPSLGSWPTIAAGALLAALASVAAGVRPAAAQQGAMAVTIVPRLAPAGAAMDSVADAGRWVILADSTVWEVHPGDRTAPDAWERGDFVAVRSNPAPRFTAGRVVYDHLLTNGPARRTVAARFVGYALPAEERR